MSCSWIITLIIMVVVAVWVLTPASSFAQTYTDLHDFNCATEGCGPTYTSLLAQGTDGNLYGTASFGGTYGYGTVFEMTPAGNMTTLYDFDGTDGLYPYGGLVLGTDGDFYGTTQFNLVGQLWEGGTVFKITAQGVLTTLHFFAGGLTDGSGPMTAPTLGNDGNFYGVTGVAEGTNTGITYKYSASSGYTVLSSLTEAVPGNGFFAPLMQGTDGNFYSTTYAGSGSGGYGAGAVYSLSPSGVVSVIYSFNSDVADGGYGYAPVVQDSGGNLYGTEASGGTGEGGVVFRVTTGGRIKLLYNFTDYCAGQPYGCGPAGGLVLGNDGNLYGSTSGGGAGNDGVLFKITKSGKYTQLFTLDGTDGAKIESTGLQHTNGTIYGIASTGGAYGGGVLYSLNVGLRPFVATLFNSGTIGTSVGVLGQDFNDAKSVSFHGTSAEYTVVSDNYLVAVVPTGATTGYITVKTTKATFRSNREFVVP